MASAATAHTLFTTLYIDGKNQGDGTCVRMPKNGATGTAPIYPITGDAMACGYGGQDPVPFVCPATSGAKLTFEFRLWPDAEQPGALDPGHKGPCAVYLKRVDDMFSDPAAGDGWFKIWHDGYDAASGEWCSDRLIAHDGLLSVHLPAGLAPGYYLVRPEILALHFAYKGDPQFYLGCAQIFVQGGAGGGGPTVAATTAEVPASKMVSIPGYVDADTAGLKFDIYKDKMPAYPMPGPDVWTPTLSASSWSAKSLKQAKLSRGAVPQSCLVKNANWCAKEVPRYADMEGCWAAVKDCYAQSKRCWDSAPASGSANCYTWSDYCSAMNDACEREEFDGPPPFRGKEKFATAPGQVPEPWGEERVAARAVDESTMVREMTADVRRDASESANATESVAGTPSQTTATAAGGRPTEDNQPGGGSQRSGGLLEVSTHGKCGPEFKQTCSGSRFGDCCSNSGECGRKARHCSCGCVPEFGSCW
ncbi:hypothetical protein V2A60_001793 [Cordyceps javanica]|uniref:lytic cellulose monooxygenase (C4-dehydrogenating) n=1 Tax=Cordyceps javanica TaxID=43265 RepID=A0A545WD62_9HYPO|nr:endoglucanase B [Cordyceps javanica]TQW11923.1 endoglucanase B [Cordyceps javanica]